MSAYDGWRLASPDDAGQDDDEREEGHEACRICRYPVGSCKPFRCVAEHPATAPPKKDKKEPKK